MTRLVIRLRVGDKKVSEALRPCNAVRPQMIALGADSQLKQLRGLCGGSWRAVEGAEPPQVVLHVSGRHAIEAAHPAFDPTVARVHVFPTNPLTQVKLGACRAAGFFDQRCVALRDHLGDRIGHVVDVFRVQRRHANAPGIDRVNRKLLAQAHHLGLGQAGVGKHAALCQHEVEIA